MVLPVRPETKHQSSKWYLRPVSKAERACAQSMFTVFFDGKKVFHKEILPADCHQMVLCRSALLFERSSSSTPFLDHRRWILHHDNVLKYMFCRPRDFGHKQDCNVAAPFSHPCDSLEAPWTTETWKDIVAATWRKFEPLQNEYWKAIWLTDWQRSKNPLRKRSKVLLLTI